MSESMKIIELQSENVKRLKAVRIKPDGNTIILNGNNEQGKSSVLDSIEMALRGKKYIPGEPLRQGERRGHTILDLGDIKVTRTYTKGGGGTLRVENQDGLSFPSPQKVLDKLLANVSFDPLEFTRLEPKKQLKVIQDLAGVDFSKLDEERALLFSNRTEVNRDLKRIEALVQAYVASEITIPDEMPSSTDLVQKINDAQDHNRKRNDYERQHSEKVEQIKGLKARLAEAEEAEKQMTKYLSNMDGLKEIEPLQEELANIETTQSAYRDHRDHERNLDEEKAIARKANQLTNKIEDIDEQKETALKEANLPVDGLELREEGVYLNGLPFDQASGAVKIKTSVALGIKMNPKLKVLIIRDGSLLDSNSLATIKTMADENDAQLWIERVGKDDESSIIIEDGEIEIKKGKD